MYNEAVFCKWVLKSLARNIKFLRNRFSNYQFFNMSVSFWLMFIPYLQDPMNLLNYLYFKRAFTDIVVRTMRQLKGTVEVFKLHLMKLNVENLTW